MRLNRSIGALISSHPKANCYELPPPEACLYFRSMADTNRFELSFVPEVSEHLIFVSLLARSRESIKQGKGLLHEDFWKAVAARTPEKVETTRGTVLPA